MAVIACEFTSRCALADGCAFGTVGPYEQLDGIVHFAADVRILRPVDSQRGNHRLLLDVPNRGNRLALWMFNHAPRPAAPSAPLDPGNGFLMYHGYTVVWCGWQHD